MFGQLPISMVKLLDKGKFAAVGYRNKFQLQNGTTLYRAGKMYTMNNRTKLQEMKRNYRKIQLVWGRLPVDHLPNITSFRYAVPAVNAKL